MTVFVRGVTRSINANFNGKIYGPIIWSAVPAASIDLAPQNGGLSCSCTVKLSAPAGAILISVSSLDRLGKKIGGTLSVTVDALAPPPAVFVPETPTANDLVTDKDAATLDLGHMATVKGPVMANVKGNGKTVATVLWPYADKSWFKQLADTPNGGKVWEDVHASGLMLVFYDCAPDWLLNPPAAGSGGGSTGGGTPTPPPAVTPPPVPAPQLTLTAKVAADRSVTVTPATPYYSVTALPDGNFLAHLGDVWAPEAAIAHLPPLHVDIVDAQDRPIISQDLRGHYWNTRVAFRTAPIAPVRSPAQLVAGDFCFPYGDTGLQVNPCADYKYWGPFCASFSGITVYMPTTGERPDIHLFADPSAWYLLTGQTGPMVAWAQCGPDFPLHHVDGHTGAIINPVTYPEADAYDLPGKMADKPYIFKGPRDPANGYPTFGGGMTPQQAHFCDMVYIFTVAMRDLIGLGTLQAGAVFCVTCNATLSTASGAVIYGERRGIAWGWGMVLKALKATADFAADGLLPAKGFLPASAFQAVSDSTLAYYTSKMKGPVQDVFGVVPGDTTVGPWQQNYFLMMLAFAILTGRKEFVEFYLQNLLFTIGLNDGRSGWAGYGTPYYIDTIDDHGVVYPDFSAMLAGFLKTELQNAATAAGHGVDYTPAITQAQYDALQKDPLNGGVAMQGQGYDPNTRAVLVIADYLDKRGLAPVRARYGQRFDDALRIVKARTLAYGRIDPKASVVSI